MYIYIYICSRRFRKLHGRPRGNLEGSGRIWKVSERAEEFWRFPELGSQGSRKTARYFIWKVLLLPMTCRLAVGVYYPCFSIWSHMAVLNCWTPKYSTRSNQCSRMQNSHSMPGEAGTKPEKEAVTWCWWYFSGLTSAVSDGLSFRTPIHEACRACISTGCQFFLLTWSSPPRFEVLFCHFFYSIIIFVYSYLCFFFIVYSTFNVIYIYIFNL